MGTTRHGYAIDHACPDLRETLKLSLSPYRRGYPIAHLRQWTARVRGEYADPSRGSRTLDSLLAVRSTTPQRSVRNNACAFPRTRPFGRNNARVLTSSDISPQNYRSVGVCHTKQPPQATQPRVTSCLGTVRFRPGFELTFPSSFSFFNLFRGASKQLAPGARIPTSPLDPALVETRVGGEKPRKYFTFFNM